MKASKITVAALGLAALAAIAATGCASADTRYAEGPPDPNFNQYSPASTLWVDPRDSQDWISLSSTKTAPWSNFALH
jgi:hypothetical protein